MASFDHNMGVPVEVWSFFQQKYKVKNPSRYIRDALIGMVQIDPYPQPFLDLCESLDLDPGFCGPDDALQGAQYDHIRFKKKILLRGYRCEGMQDPNRTLSFIIRDIQDRTPWDELGPSGQASYRALQDKYRQWIFKNNGR